MVEVIYRIYEVADNEQSEQILKQKLEFGLYSNSKVHNIEVCMDCILCDSREHFKEIIRSQYGNNIAFRYSKKLSVGELYCVIIGEHCYNTERYFNKVEFNCDCCGAKVETYYGKPICYSDYEVQHTFYRIIP